MKAAVLSPPDASKPDYAVAKISDIPTPQISNASDVLIKLSAAALNHRGEQKTRFKLFNCVMSVVSGSALAGMDAPGSVEKRGQHDTISRC